MAARKRYTEQQIAFALKQAETGTPPSEIIRKMGICEQTFYTWKKKYAGMDLSELISRFRFQKPVYCAELRA